MTTLAKLMGSGVPGQQAQSTTAGVPLTGQTATGSTQGTAFAITSDFVVFSTVAASTGARLPAASAPSLTAQAGDVYVVVNYGANALAVYPPTGGNISNAGVNASVSIPANKTGDFYCIGNNLWAASIGT
jgi:hypothetical protein